MIAVHCDVCDKLIFEEKYIRDVTERLNDIATVRSQPTFDYISEFERFFSAGCDECYEKFKRIDIFELVKTALVKKILDMPTHQEGGGVSI